MIHSSLKRVVSLLACIVTASSALSVPSYKMETLPDLGFGGRANGLLVMESSGGDLDFNDGVVGLVRDGVGGTRATYWRRSGQVWSATPLQGLGGMSSQAFAGWRAELPENTTELIVGVTDTGQWNTPTIWISTDNVNYPAFGLPSLGGPNGRAVDVVPSNDPQGGFFIIGTSQVPGGNSHATLWHYIPGLPIEIYDLGTAGGSNSEATAISPSVNGNFTIAGRVQTASGQWNAYAWDLDNDGLFGIVTGRNLHPGGLSSEFTGLGWFAGSQNRVYGCGSVRLANGRWIAGVWDLDNDGNFGDLLTPGANNAAATDLVGTQYGNITFGQAWNDPASRRSVVWNTISASGRTVAYPLSAIGEGASDTVAFISAAGPGAAVGYTSGLRVTDDNPVSASTNGIQLPDLVAVSKGKPENRFNETDIWRSNDGKSLRVTDNNPQILSRTFLPKSPSASDGIDISLRARTLGNARAMSMARVEVYNIVTYEWDFAFQQGYMWDYGDGTATIPAAAHVDPESGEVRLRVTFTQQSGKVRGVEVDSFYISSDSTL